MKKGIVWAKLPNAGLGNLLLVWARARIYAHQNGLDLYTTGWGRFRPGPYLRKEKIKRQYAGYFKSPGAGGAIRLLATGLLGEKVIEPPLNGEAPPGKVCVFNRIPPWNDYFGDLHPHRALVKTALAGYLAAGIHRRLQHVTPPVIAVHIRRGDFKELPAGADFKSLGGVRTPLQYFTDLIENIRRVHGKSLPVTVFSDGYPHELQPVLGLDHVTLAAPNPDIVDILLMSKSKLIITSAGSTFSYWAAFLADAPVIVHPDHIHSPIRDADTNRAYYEGAATGPPDEWPELLRSNIRSIQP